MQGQLPGEGLGARSAPHLGALPARPFPWELGGDQATVVSSGLGHLRSGLGHQRHKRVCPPSLRLGPGCGLQAEGFLATRMSPEPGAHPDLISCCQRAE